MKAKERYKLMTREQRKVAIAKDVIKQVNAGVLHAKDGCGYLVTKRSMKEPVDIDKKNALDVAKRCTVCARGALMISKISKFNDHVVASFDGFLPSWETSFALEDAFDYTELRLIEKAFENEWSDRHPNPNDRLIAIMQNLIDHDGEFNPDVEYVVKYVK